MAARLQAECPPGGICVSRSVRDHVHGRLDLTFEELGALNLKNIAYPVEAFLALDDATSRPPLKQDIRYCRYPKWGSARVCGGRARPRAGQMRTLVHTSRIRMEERLKVPKCHSEGLDY